LIEHGHRKIAHLEGPEKLSIAEKRKNGFVDAMQHHGLSISDEWMVPSALQEKGGFQAMNRLLELPANKRPEAVVAVNDPVAFGAMHAIYEAGYAVPDDFALVGFSDDIRAKLMTSPLTTIRQPAYKIGKRSSQKLISLIEDSDEEVDQVTVPTELIVRESCGCKVEKENAKKTYMEFAD
jgi:DNA-binding LacI/PurR family transcriptional regulator